jgi:formylglycine-generating enzyme required for sulfatase activity
LLAFACSRGGAPSSPIPDAAIVTDAAVAIVDAGSPEDAGEDIWAFKLPDAAPYDSPTCHHPPTVKDCKDGLCRIPAGCFLMGSDSEEPHRFRYGEEQREATLTHPFLIGDHEVTQAEWVSKGFQNSAGPSRNPNEPVGASGTSCIGDACPIGFVSWQETWLYLNKLNDAEGLPHCVDVSECTGTQGVDFACKMMKQNTESLYECTGYRLPTLVEWEYAARGGTQGPFYNGLPVPEDCGRLPGFRAIAWGCANANKTTHPVKQLQPNHFGLYDVFGNAAELIGSNPEYDVRPKGPLVDHLSKLDFSKAFRDKGDNYTGLPLIYRVASANGPISPRSRGEGLGFRIARSLPKDSGIDAGADAH